MRVLQLHDDEFLPITDGEFLELSRKNRDKSAINYGHLYKINKKTLEAILALRDHSIENLQTNLFLEGKQIFKVIVENGTIYCIQKEQERLFRKAHAKKLELFNFSLFSVLIHTADVALQNCRFVPGRKKTCWLFCS
jgi:helix-turn-helix protein